MRHPTPDFRPTLFLKKDCPHCFKVRLFLLEAGLAELFDEHEFAPGDDEETPTRTLLSAHFAKVTFPTVSVAPRRYMNESDDIIAHYADLHGIDPTGLPIFTTYARVLQPRLRRLRNENRSLVARLQQYEQADATD